MEISSMQSSSPFLISAYPKDIVKMILSYFIEGDDPQTIGNTRLANKTERDKVNEVLPYLINAFFKKRCDKLQTQGETRTQAIQGYYDFLCKIESVSGHPDEIYDKIESTFRSFLCHYQRIFPNPSLFSSMSWKDYSANYLHKITRKDPQALEWSVEKLSEIYTQSLKDPTDQTDCLLMTENPCIFNGMSIFRLLNCEVMLQHLRIISNELNKVNQPSLPVFLKGGS